MPEKERAAAKSEQAPKTPAMKKVVETKEDGRLIIYYSFVAREIGEKAGDNLGADSGARK